MLVPERFTGEGIIEKIRLIAQATGSAERGECLARLVEADLGALAALRARMRKVLFVLSFVNGRPMVAGRATAADGIIALAGARNAVTDYDGYKLVNDEAIIAARPDAILVMERASFQLDATTVFAHPAFGADRCRRVAALTSKTIRAVPAAAKRTNAAATVVQKPRMTSAPPPTTAATAR